MQDNGADLEQMMEAFHLAALRARASLVHKQHSAKRETAQQPGLQ